MGGSSSVSKDEGIELTSEHFIETNLYDVVQEPFPSEGLPAVMPVLSYITIVESFSSSGCEVKYVKIGESENVDMRKPLIFCVVDISWFGSRLKEMGLGSLHNQKCAYDCNLCLKHLLFIIIIIG